MVFLSDGSKAWAVGYEGAVVHSGDGGETWSAQNSGTDAVLNSVWFASETFGTAVGESGTVIRTTDGGSTWESVESGQPEDLFGVFFLDDSNGWAVGARNLVVHSTDGGTSWAMEETTSSGDSLKGIMFTNVNSGLAAGSGGRIWKFGPRPLDN